MPAPAAASRHYLRLQRIKAVTLLGVRRAWRRIDQGGNWERQYELQVGPQITGLVVAAQIAVTNDSDLYVAEVLNELDFGPVTEPGVVLSRSLAGVAGDGRPVESLLATSVGRARATAADLRTTNLGDSARVTGPTTAAIESQALDSGQAFMEMIAESLIADAARAAEEVAMAQRPWVDGWVRMINPPCCSRCAILSGEFFLFNEGFLRHPRCDCYHVPAPSKGPALTAMLATESPERYFESLSEAEQDRIFTRAGAEAIREGADMGRVVNARRGMSKAQVNGRDVLVTSAGIAGTRRGRGRRPVRLMPSAIFDIAGDDRAEAIRLLKVHGYIT